MTDTIDQTINVAHPDRFYIGGQWVQPSSANHLDLVSPVTEHVFMSVAAAANADMDKAVVAARDAFDNGPWPRMSPPERASYMRRPADTLRRRTHPVGCVIPYDTEAEAIAMANDSPYGLAGSVFTNDADAAWRVARAVRTGTVSQNGPKFDFSIAFGGFKQSGVGREGGKEGLRAYIELKTVILDGPGKSGQPAAGASAQSVAA